MPLRDRGYLETGLLTSTTVGVVEQVVGRDSHGSRSVIDATEFVINNQPVGKASRWRASGGGSSPVFGVVVRFQCSTVGRTNLHVGGYRGPIFDDARSLIPKIVIKGVHHQRRWAS